MVTKALLYYTCLSHPLDIELACRAQLLKCCNGNELVSVSRNKPIKFGDNLVVGGDRSILTMHLQILAGLESTTSDIIFLCENDVLYHPSHFDFIPPRTDTFYYNTNVWKVRYTDGHAVWTDDLQQVSGICADWYLMHDFYSRRVQQIRDGSFDRHYEPGPKIGNWKTANWQSAYPNIDIRHNKTLTKSKWSPSEFRNQKYARGWREASEVTGWGITEGRFDEFLREVNYG